jgi:hypothetical protein
LKAAKRRESELGQKIVKQPVKDDSRRLPISLHGFGTGLRIAGVGYGAQANEGWRPAKVFYIACEDLKSDRRFVVNAGSGSYPIDDRTTAISLHELAAMLVALDE